MFSSLITKIFSFILSIWTSLSDEQKEKIINLIIDSFDVVFRKFFQENKKGSNHE